MSRAVLEAFRGIGAILQQVGQRRTVVPLIEDIDARDGQIIVGVGDGQVIRLPALTDGQIGAIGIVLTDVVNPVTVVNPDGTTTSLGAAGAYDFVAGEPNTYQTNPGGTVLAGGVPTDSLIGRDTAGTGAAEFITATGGLEFSGSKSLRIADLGVTTAKLAANAVTNAKLATMTAASVKGRALGASTGDPTDLTQTQLGDLFRIVSGTSDTIAPGTFNDYVVAESTKLLRIALSASGDANITGFLLGSSNTGGWIRLFKQGSTGRIVLKHGTGSSANNQILTPESIDYVLDGASEAVDLQYIGGRWQVIGRNSHGDRLGAPVYDAQLDFGAVGDGVTDDTAAIQAGIDACEATGGILYLGRSHLITSTLVVSGDGVTLQGRGIHPTNGTKISFNGAGTSCKAVQFLGFQHSGIRDCYIQAAKVYTADALLEFDGTFRGFATNISLTNGYNAIHVYRSTETWITDFQVRNPFGPRGVLFEGTSVVHSYRCILERAGLDCPYPFAIVGLGAAWTASQAVVQGTIRHNSDGIWSCSAAGTTSGAGTGPAKSSIATTDPSTYRTTNVTDGTATWRWVCDRNLSWITLDSYASTLTVSKLALISGVVGVRHSNTVGGTSARGDGIIATDLEIDHAYDFGIFLEDGYDASFHAGTVTSCQFDSGVRIGAGYGVDWSITGMRIFGHAKHGVSVAHGSGKIQNNRIGHNGALTSNTYDGISVDDGVTRLDITDNFVGELGYTGNAQRTGIQLNGTLSDNYCVTGNVCAGNLTAGIFNGAGVSSTRIVRNNVPDTTTGIILDADYGDITVSSSSTVWTIDNDVVSNAKLANMAARTIKGRADSAGTGDPTDLTGTQVGAILRFGNFVGDTTAGAITTFTVAAATNMVTFNGVTNVVHGISVPTEAGQRLIIQHIGTGTTTLVHESSSAGAASQRIRLGDYAADTSALVLDDATGITAEFIHDGTRWIWVSGGVSINAVDNTRLADMATATFKGRTTAGSGDPEDLTATQAAGVLVGQFPPNSAEFVTYSANATLTAERVTTSSTSVTVSTSVANQIEFQRAALTGDVTATANSNATTIANDAVTNAKLNNMAGATVKGRTLNAGSGDPTDMTGAEVGQLIRYGTDVEDTSTGTVASFTIANTTTSVRCTPASALTIQGIAYTGPADPEAGKEVILYNSRTSTQNITLAHNSGSAGAAQYRLFLPGNVDMVMRPGDAIRLRYAFSRWIGGSPASVSDADYGDITVTAGGGTWTIDANTVTDAKLRQSAGLSVIARSANTTGNVADVTAGTDGHVLRRSGTALGFGTIATAGITDAAVTLAKQADLAQSTIIGRAEGSGTGVPTALSPSQVTAIIDAETLFWTGAHDFAAAVNIRGSIRFATVATAVLATQQDNFTAGAVTQCRFTLTGSQSLSGIVPDTVSEECVMLVVNADDTDNLTLLHNNAASTNTNRFFLPGNTDRVLLPRASALIHYDVTDGRWHMVYGV